MRQAPGDSADHRRLSLKDFNTSDIRAMLAGRSAPLSEAEILRLLTGGKALPGSVKRSSSSTFPSITPCTG